MAKVEKSRLLFVPAELRACRYRPIQQILLGTVPRQVCTGYEGKPGSGPIAEPDVVHKHLQGMLSLWTGTTPDVNGVEGVPQAAVEFNGDSAMSSRASQPAAQPGGCARRSGEREPQAPEVRSVRRYRWRGIVGVDRAHECLGIAKEPNHLPKSELHPEPPMEMPFRKNQLTIRPPTAISKGAPKRTRKLLAIAVPCTFAPESACCACSRATSFSGTA